MRIPLSSCRKYLALAPRGDGDRCLEGSVAASGTSVLVPSRLVCDPVKGRRDDEGVMNAGDENCGVESKVKTTRRVRSTRELTYLSEFARDEPRSKRQAN